MLFLGSWSECFLSVNQVCRVTTDRLIYNPALDRKVRLPGLLCFTFAVIWLIARVFTFSWFWRCVEASTQRTCRPFSHIWTELKPLSALPRITTWVTSSPCFSLEGKFAISSNNDWLSHSTIGFFTVVYSACSQECCHFVFTLCMCVTGDHRPGGGIWGELCGVGAFFAGGSVWKKILLPGEMALSL